MRHRNGAPQFTLESSGSMLQWTRLRCHTALLSLTLLRESGLGRKILMFILLNIFTLSAYSQLGNPIEEAESLFLHKQRKAAAESLLKEIRRYPRSKYEAEAKSTLMRMSETFLTESALKLYQEAESYEDQDTKISQAKLEKALAMEPDHPKVLRALVKVAYRNRNCEETENGIKKLELNYPYDENLPLFYDYLALCRRQWDRVGLRVDGESQTASSQIKFFRLWALAFSELRLEKISGLKEKLSLLKKEEQDFPETLSLEMDLNKLLGRENSLMSQKYQQLCSNLNMKRKSKYRWAYELCPKERINLEAPET